MHVLAPLWLPILVSAVVVFVAAGLVWMALPHHKKDIKTLPDEKAVTDLLKKLDPPPGMYMFPGCGDDCKDMKSPEYQARFKAGPWGSVNIMASQPSFARNLVLTFICYAVISLFVGYITLLAREPGEAFMSVFRVAGAVGVLAYCAGSIPNAIFFGKPGRFVLTDLADGIACGLLTGATFAWLWPAA